MKMTMQSTINGAATFNTVAGPAKVTNAAWLKMVGAFTPSSIATALLLYIEGASATSSYYVDGFSIGLSNGGCTNPPDNSGFSSGFESGTSEDWVSRGGGSLVVLTPTMADAHTGSWSPARRKAHGARLCEGAVWGFTGMTVILLILRATHSFSFGPVELRGRQFLIYALGWEPTFLQRGFLKNLAFAATRNSL